MHIELSYNEFSATSFYIGNVGMDFYAAFESAIKYIEEHYTIDNYTELVQLKGKYRLQGQWDELLEQLEETFNTLDALCADINSNGWSKHWSL